VRVAETGNGNHCERVAGMAFREDMDSDDSILYWSMDGVVVRIVRKVEYARY
jgi:hypothetical protein